MIAAVSLLLLGLIWHPWWGRQISLRAVDADGRPLGGVIGVATWVMTGGLEGGNTYGVLAAREGVSDLDGKLAIPGWGPTFPTWRQVGRSRLRSGQPRVILLRPGYEVRVLYNRDLIPGTPVRGFSESGEEIVLRPFTGTPAEYRNEVDRITGELYPVVFNAHRPCAWRDLRVIWTTLEKLSGVFQSQGLLAVGPSLRSNESLMKERGCGSVAEFLGEQ